MMEEDKESSLKDLSIRIGCIIDTAIKKEISWTTLASILNEMTPTLSKSKQVINILLAVLQNKLQEKPNEDRLDMTPKIEVNENVDENEIIVISKTADESNTEVETNIENIQQPEKSHDIDRPIDDSKDDSDSELLNRNEKMPNKSLTSPKLSNDLAEDVSSNSKPITPLVIKVKRKNECEKCKKQFSTKHTLKTHMNTHLENKPYECKICKGQYASKQYLQQHMTIHTGEKPYQCQACLKTFGYKKLLKYHEKIHVGDLPECNTCKKKFTTNKTLAEHMVVHTGEKPYQCQTCMKNFAFKQDMRVHEKQHTQDKPFECNTCLKRFFFKKDMKKHLRIHTGEKPYQCQTCMKFFSDSSGLHTHMKIHKGEKLHQCILCSKSFTQKTSLTKHELSHTKRNISK